MSLESTVRAAFESSFEQAPQGLASAPGRVNLLGEHVDYNGGLALPCAINLRAHFACSTRADRIADIVAVDLGQRCQFYLDEVEQKKTIEGNPLPEWAQYVAGVGWALNQAGFELTGMSGAIHSNIPIGAGLSSSAALEVASATAWLALAEQRAKPMQVARFCQRAENEFVGVASGLMDQWTVTHGQAGHALLLDFARATAQPVLLPESIALIITHSGTPRALSSSAYSQRVQECRQVLRTLQRTYPDLEHLGHASLEQLEAKQAELSTALFQRGRHVISEVERVRQAVEGLLSGETEEIGPLLIQSHASLRDDFQVSNDELDLLVELAVGLPGCSGARLTGAGFGGCTINWVEKSEANHFTQQLVSQYRSKTGLEPRAWICQAVEGASWRRLSN